MNAKLKYAIFNQQDCLDDVIAVLTGETNLANLSTSLDQSQSEILSTISAGWTLHDIPDTDARVIKAPHSDDPSVMKYARIRCDASRNWRIQVYEDWDNILHEGFNETPVTTVSTQASLTSDAVLYVFSSSSFFSVISDRSTQWGYSYNGIPIVAEYASEQAGNIVPAYPNFCFIDTYRSIYYGSIGGVYPVRAKNTSGNDVVGNAGSSFLTGIGIGLPGSDWINDTYFKGGSGSKIVDQNGNFKFPFFELFIQNPNLWSSAPLGNITTNTNIYMAARDVLSNHENVLKLTETFRAVKCYNNGLTMLFPKG
jgi:hypothetical protein